MLLPPSRNYGSTASLAWRLIGELLYGEYVEEHSSQETDETWLNLRSEAVNGAADVFFHLQSAGHVISWDLDVKNQDLYCWSKLLRNKSQIRDLLEHSLLHLDQLVSMAKWDQRDQRDRFIVQTLGAIGSPSTVAILRQFISHPILGTDAVAAIEKINGGVA